MTDPRIAQQLAAQRAAELRAAAERRRTPGVQPPLAQPEQPVTLRFAAGDDQVALARLAALDSTVAPFAPVLLAEVDGSLRAALSLSDGTVVADPFHRSIELVELLRARARQLGREPRRRFAGRGLLVGMRSRVGLIRT